MTVRLDHNNLTLYSRFRISCLCCDSTGVIAIRFEDREIRRLTGKTVFDVTLDVAEVYILYSNDVY